MGQEVDRADGFATKDRYGSNKYITESELREYVEDPEKIDKAKKNIVNWDDKKAQVDQPAQTIEDEKRYLEDTIRAREAEILDAGGWVQAVREADDFATLQQIWRQLFGARPDESTQTYQRWQDVAPEDYGFIQMQRKNPVASELNKQAMYEFVTLNEKKKIQFENCAFVADVAKTQAQKAAGLEVFDYLHDNEGLLFPFEKPSHVTFHMGKVDFPIDIIFLLDDPLGLKIGKIIHNAQPGAIDRWSCPDTICVLEVKGGMCKKKEIQVGSLCEILDRITEN
jgi:uncharacterized membrane protein (UPF0127 family)